MRSLRRNQNQSKSSSSSGFGRKRKKKNEEKLHLQTIEENFLSKLKTLNKFFHYDYMVVPSLGTSGGLWMMWLKSMKVTVLHSSSNFIHVTVGGTGGYMDWDLIGVYGSPTLGERALVWNQIKAIAAQITNPWCCLGDFNAISNIREKSGGSSFIYKTAQDFNDMLMQCNLMDLGFSGPAYTWTNKRQAIFNIFNTWTNKRHELLQTQVGGYNFPQHM